MSAKRALVTGITVQDGAYLSKLLLDKGYVVHGMLRRSASSDVVNSRLRWIGTADKVTRHDGDLKDAKAKQNLGWVAETTLEQLIAEMVDADIARLQRQERL